MTIQRKEIGYKPTHPDLFRVNFQPGSYTSSLRALKGFHADEKICAIEGITTSPKAWSSVQYGPGPQEHFELNSDLVYINHSCEPNVAFDISSPDKSKWSLIALRDISKGSDLVFFYPSTEWDMDQAFDCSCHAETCLKYIAGASALSFEQLIARGYVSRHILELVARRDGKKQSESVGIVDAPMIEV